MKELIQEIRQGMPAATDYCYLNTASVGPMPRYVAEAVRSYLELANTTDNIWDGEQLLCETRDLAAQLLHVSPGEIAFVPSTSAGINIVASGIDWREGDNVVVPAGEFPANVYPYLAWQDKGVEIRRVEHNGQFTAADIIACVDERTRVVNLSLVQFATGFRADVRELGQFCRERGILLVVDAIQAVGALDVDPQSLGIDVLVAGGQKWLLAVPGIAIMYVRRDVQDLLKPAWRGWTGVRNYMQCLTAVRDDPWPSAFRYHISTPNNPALFALRASLKVLQQIGIEHIESRNLWLADLLRQGLQEQGYQLVCRNPAHFSQIVSFFAPHAADLYNFLKRQGIIVSLREGNIRVSPHFFNLAADIERLLTVLRTYRA